MAGTLVIIGGHEDREGDKVVLKDIVERARGRRVVVVTTASEEPDDLFATYRKAFTALGVKDVVQLHSTAREDNLDEAAAEAVKRCGVVFFTGGDQLRLVSQVGDTPVFQAIHKHFHDGGVVAGTSAGASVMSDTMLVSGESGASPRGGDAIQMAPGFSLIEGVVVDQHFAERGRMGRLLAAVAQNPKSLGVGLDENTAIVVERARFTVIGAGGVYAVNGATVTFSTVADVSNDQPFSIDDVTLHVLAPGDRFDLKRRRPIHPGRTEE